mmetsp:Transcript_9839/g.23761  ORF Transcript_9839/g.23761 Transcript_9839/m.23761 type:complete len:105 (+) Transcript_9839:723-1037(+)
MVLSVLSQNSILYQLESYCASNRGSDLMPGAHDAYCQKRGCIAILVVLAVTISLGQQMKPRGIEIPVSKIECGIEQNRQTNSVLHFRLKREEDQGNPQEKEQAP